MRRPSGGVAARAVPGKSRTGRSRRPEDPALDVPTTAVTGKRPWSRSAGDAVGRGIADDRFSPAQFVPMGVDEADVIRRADGCRVRVDYRGLGETRRSGGRREPGRRDEKKRGRSRRGINLRGPLRRRRRGSRPRLRAGRPRRRRRRRTRVRRRSDGILLGEVVALVGLDVELHPVALAVVVVEAERVAGIAVVAPIRRRDAAVAETAGSPRGANWATATGGPTGGRVGQVDGREASGYG